MPVYNASVQALQSLIEIVPIESVHCNTANPRTIKDSKFKQLVKSIKDFPEMLNLRPVVVDENNIALGGNKRLEAARAAGLAQIPIIKAAFLTPSQQKEFIIKDNVSFGEWDWQSLTKEWSVDLAREWGLDIPGVHLELSVDDLTTDFKLNEGAKNPFGQMTFILADDQSTLIKNAIDEIKESDEYKYMETFGNVNANGNALYLIVSKFISQKDKDAEAA
jgi:hypothetical protein